MADFLIFRDSMFPSGSPFNFVCGISPMTKLVARVLSFCLAYDGKVEVASDTTWSRTLDLKIFPAYKCLTLYE